MKNVYLFVFASIVFYGCGDLVQEPENNTHLINGKVIHQFTKDPIANINIRNSGTSCSLISLGGICGDLSAQTSSDEMGQFNFNFETPCDALIAFNINDTNDSILLRNSRWIFQDNNLNDLGIGCYSNQIRTVKDTPYDLIVNFQPQQCLKFNFINNDTLDFFYVSIPDLNFRQDSSELVSNSFFDIFRCLDISDYQGTFEVLSYYKSGDSLSQTISYDYFANDDTEINIQK